MGNRVIRPLFIFSLPRSGSTLLQRALATHPTIATTSEPWLLLPLMYTRIHKRAYADYAHYGAVNAIKDFCSILPDGEADYLYEMREFILRLYSKAAPQPEAVYFLDKTPRYHLIVDEIIKMFPEGRFVFLWRNPLAVIASIVRSMGGGRWNLYRYNVDLFLGMARLIDACERFADRVHVVNYENLVSNANGELERLFGYLNLPFEPDRISEFYKVDLSGRYGDPTGVKAYQTITNDPLDKWKETIVNPFRKEWCRNYLQWLGRDRLALMGYSQDEMLRDLAEIPFSGHAFINDLANHLYGNLFRTFELRILSHKLKIPSRHDRNAHL